MNTKFKIGDWIIVKPYNELVKTNTSWWSKKVENKIGRITSIFKLFDTNIYRTSIGLFYFEECDIKKFKIKRGI